MTKATSHRRLFAGVLALIFLPVVDRQTVAAPATADSQAHVEAILQELKLHPVNADAVQTARSIERLKELGELGPDAASAVPLLLSEDFFLIKGGYTETDKPLRLATIDTLVRIGDPAVPEVIKLLSMPKGRNNFEWKHWGRVILRKMAKTETVDTIIRLLVEKMQTAQQKPEFYELLASLGPKSIPLLEQEVRAILAKKNLALADTNNLRRLGGLLGKEMGPAIDAVIPERYTEATWGDERYWIHYRAGWYPLAHARPGPQHIPALLDLVRNETLNGERYYEGVRHVGMILSTLGEAPVAPLADLLHADNVETRWAAAFILTMIGNHATTALPALEETYRKPDEDLGVRVAAARAIGQIKGVEPLDLYQTSPISKRRWSSIRGNGPWLCRVVGSGDTTLPTNQTRPGRDTCISTRRRRSTSVRFMDWPLVSEWRNTISGCVVT